MKINKEKIEYIAQLARLNFNEKEKEKLITQMSNTLNYVEKLNDIDTSGVKPLEHMGNMQSVFRKDIVQTSMAREKLLENAMETEDGAFSVPEIIE